MPLAWTRTRLKGFITLRTIPGGTFLANPAAIAQNLSATQLVGAAAELEVTQEREANNFRREFSPDTVENGGIPIETYPGLPHFSATLRRVDLYEANLMEAFGFNDVNIAAQYKPFVIIVEQPTPEESPGVSLTIPGGRMKKRTYVLDGCWFGTMPIEFNINDADQKQLVEVEVMVRNVSAFMI